MLKITTEFSQLIIDTENFRIKTAQDFSSHCWKPYVRISHPQEKMPLLIVLAADETGRAIRSTSTSSIIKIEKV